MTMNHRQASRRKLRHAGRQAQRHLPRGLPGLFFLTDPTRTPDPVAIAARLPRGTGIIYRHFGSDDRANTATALARLAARRRLVLLIAADPALARKVGAHGLHWPEARRLEATRWRKAFPLQTTSAHSPVALRQSARMGFDAALMSTVFPSRSPSAGKPLGAVRFRLLCRRSGLPVFALGGMSAGGAGRVSPVAGIAAIDAIEGAFGD